MILSLLGDWRTRHRLFAVTRPSCSPMILDKRRQVVTLPSLMKSSTSMLPSTILSAPKQAHKYETHLSTIPGAADLRERASSIFERRHTTIQVQLAAAHINTSIIRGRGGSHAHPMKGGSSPDLVWDDYVKIVAERRRLVDASTRKKKSFAKQMDKFAMYVDTYALSRRASCIPHKPKLTLSEVQTFEILRKAAAPPAAAAGTEKLGISDNRVTIADASTHLRTSARENAAAAFRRRRSVRPVIPPLVLSKFAATSASPTADREGPLSPARDRRRAGRE